MKSSQKSESNQGGPNEIKVDKILFELLLLIVKVRGKNNMDLQKLDKENIIEKSIFLCGMDADFDLGEFKIIDIYLSKINARDKKTRLVKFKKSEYEKLLGLKQARPEILEKHTSRLLKNIATIPRKDGGYEQYPLFSSASCKKDKNTGQWVLELDGNKKLDHIFFNIEDDGYMRYKLKSVIYLNSVYYLKLFLFLKENSYKGSFQVRFKELLKILGVTAKRYENFKYFNDEILKKGQKTLKEKADMSFTYKKVIEDRSTEILLFHINNKENVSIKKISKEIDPIGEIMEKYYPGRKR